MDVKNSQKAALGLKGIVVQFVKFFNTTDKVLRTNDDKARRKLIQQLDRQMAIGKKLSHKGYQLTKDIEESLNDVVEIITSTNVLDDKFNAAKSGLKGATDLSEEATLQIGETAEQLQNSLQEVKEELTNTLQGAGLPDDTLAIVNENLKKLDSMGDSAFNIAVALQFQDILRQQLSAIAGIMSNTKNQLAEIVNKLTGAELEITEEEQLVTTDDSILSASGDQDEVDALINQAKQK